MAGDMFGSASSPGSSVRPGARNTLALRGCEKDFTQSIGLAGGDNRRSKHIALNTVDPSRCCRLRMHNHWIVDIADLCRDRSTAQVLYTARSAQAFV